MATNNPDQHESGSSSGEAYARSEALRLLTEYQVRDLQDLDLEAISMAEGMIVTYGPIQSAEAWLIGLRSRAMARIRESIPFIGQKRFAIAHELGHWTLHRGRTDQWICTASDLSDYKRRPEEIEANAFASQLILPDFLIQPCLSDVQGLECLLRMAEEFRCGPIVTARRFLSLTDRDAQLVVSMNGKTLYFQRSEETRMPPIYPRRTIPPQSPTAQAALGNGVQTASISPRSWFGWVSPPRGPIREWAIALPPEGQVLTLLVAE
jgi:hypothetical protein